MDLSRKTINGCFIRKNDSLVEMESISLDIIGKQIGLLFNFQIKQIFSHSEAKSAEVHYFFPNDLKTCLNGLSFYVNNKPICPYLISKQCKRIKDQKNVNKKKFTIFSTKKENGITQIALGNVPPNRNCEVYLSITMSAQLTKENSFFLKFPFDIYTPKGSSGSSISNSPNFSFKLQNFDTPQISKIWSNFKSGVFNGADKSYTIMNTKAMSQKSLILNFETVQPIQSCIINEYNSFCAISLVPNLPITNDRNKEFVFLVDCSGSMKDMSIKRASECLEVFIRSLPPNCFFNVIRFGSTYTKLFPDSLQYDEKTAQLGIQCAAKLEADLKGTNIFTPLSDLFHCKCSHGQRQVFILTDGEVPNTEQVIDLVMKNANENRCFSVGIGRGCDAALVESVANFTGGKCDFVQEGDMITEKVIPLLQSSISPPLSSLEIEVPGLEKGSYEIAPINNINNKGAGFIYLMANRPNAMQNIKDNGVFIRGKYGSETINLHVNNIINFDANQAFFDRMTNSHLFYFTMLQQYEYLSEISNEDMLKCTFWSTTGMVLSKYTCYAVISMSRFTNRVVGRSQIAPSESKNDIEFTIQKIPNQKNKSSNSAVETNRLSEIQHKTRNGFDFMSLIRLQNIIGYWENLNEINSIIGIEINDIPEIKIDDLKLHKRCIATIIAVSALHIKSPESKDVWCMIEEKAINWLKSVLHGIDINYIISKVEKMIKDSQ